MSTLDRITRASTSGIGRRASSTELDWADLQVAVARDRVEHLTMVIEDAMRRGNPTAQSRALLRTFQQILREMVVHRDAIFIEFMKARPKTESAAVDPQEPKETPYRPEEARHEHSHRNTAR